MQSSATNVNETNTDAASANESSARTVIGKVVSDKMQKTIVVMVERTVKHRKYGKIIQRKVKLHAHDENEISKIGDLVKIQETKPFSKMKNWFLVEVISQS